MESAAEGLVVTGARKRTNWRDVRVKEKKKTGKMARERERETKADTLECKGMRLKCALGCPSGGHFPILVCFSATAC